MNKINVERYGKHSFYNVSKRITPMHRDWYLLQKKIDKWYTGTQNPGRHQSLVGDNNLYGDAHRAGQVDF